jgi:nucleotide-binding universal stress UspA family protein
MDVATGIVVGVDGSDSSARAVDFAFNEGALRHAEVEVVHAWMPGVRVSSVGVPTREDPAVSEARAKDILEEMVDDGQRRASGRPPAVHQVLLEGRPADILERKSQGKSLLVVGSHGLGPVTGALFGSVSEHCVLHAMAPVTVIPHSRSAPSRDGRVVVGVDGSACSYAALRWAAEEAGWRSAPLVVVHTWWMAPSLGSFGGFDRDRVAAECADDAQQLAREMTDGVLGRASRQPASVSTLSVEARAGRFLVEVAEGADLLVVGTHGRGGLRHLVGSVSRHVLQHATCPVTVLREVRS